MIVVDRETLQAVMPKVGGAKGERQARIVAAIAGTLQDTLARYQITTSLRIAHFLAQIAHESDGFCTCEEYASGAAYEGRADLGNTQKGDGVRYKGRGLIQLTGRRNYRVYGQRIGIDLVADPERAEEPVTALVLACEYWTQTAGGLNRFADQDDILSITRAINGGLNGIDDRRRYLERARLALARTLAAGMALGQPDGALQVLRRGMTSAAVEGLQRALARAGFPVTIDGAFGAGTEAMVRAFQRAKGLGDDGLVGPRTWAALGGPAEAAELITVVPQAG